MPLPHFSSTFDGIRLHVHAKPFSSISKVKLIRDDGLLEVTVAARLKGGEANDELCRCLAEFFELPKSQVTIESGHKSRNKIVLLRGASLSNLEDRLSHGLEEEKS